VVGGEGPRRREQDDGWPGGDEPGHGGGVGGGDVPARGSVSAAIEGRRLARLTLDSQPQLRPEPAEQLDQAGLVDHFDHVACSRQLPGSALRGPWRPPL